MNVPASDWSWNHSGNITHRKLNNWTDPNGVHLRILCKSTESLNHCFSPILERESSHQTRTSCRQRWRHEQTLRPTEMNQPDGNVLLVFYDSGRVKTSGNRRQASSLRSWPNHSVWGKKKTFFLIFLLTIYDTRLQKSYQGQAATGRLSGFPASHQRCIVLENQGQCWRLRCETPVQKDHHLLFLECSSLSPLILTAVLIHKSHPCT